MATITPFLSQVIQDGNEINSVFDRRLTTLIFTYYILFTLKTFIDITTNPTDVRKAKIVKRKSRKEDETDYELTTDVALKAVNVAVEDADELAIARGEKKQLSQKMAEILTVFLSIMSEEKETINYNYDAIMDKVLRSKEKEKEDIKADLKGLTDAERQVEKVFKVLALGRWNVGKQKGVTQYDKDFYDQERENIEKRARIDIALGKNKDVTEMNKEIYALDYEEAQAVAEALDNEAYGMGDNAYEGDFGDREDREDVLGYAYGMDDARYEGDPDD
jgi:hypothetical protein